MKHGVGTLIRVRRDIYADWKHDKAWGLGFLADDSGNFKASGNFINGWIEL